MHFLSSITGAVDNVLEENDQLIHTHCQVSRDFLPSFSFTIFSQMAVIPICN